MRKKVYLTMLIFAVLSVSGCAQKTGESRGVNEVAFDRVVQRKQLRCGYAEWPKSVEQDPETGELRGAYVDYMHEVGRVLGIKIIWELEVPFADLAQALSSDKVDAVCSGIWPVAERSAHLSFTHPIAYNQVKAYVRADDNRFDGDISRVNHVEVTVATIDGELSSVLKERSFPLARAYSLSKLTDGPQLLLSLTSHKADIAFTDPTLANRFLKAHPDSIRAVELDRPVAAYGMSTALKKGDWKLQELLNTATTELLLTGVIDQILRQYEESPEEFLRVRLPFESK